jgi:hypothetical protein
MYWCSMVMAPETTSSEWGPVACSASNCLGQHVLFHGICHHHHFFTRLVHFQGEGGGCVLSVRLWWTAPYYSLFISHIFFFCLKIYVFFLLSYYVLSETEIECLNKSSSYDYGMNITRPLKLYPNIIHRPSNEDFRPQRTQWAVCGFAYFLIS